VRDERMIGTSLCTNKHTGDLMADNTVRGRFVWHELMTPNRSGAHDFYSSAVGWKSQAWEQDSSYLMFSGSAGPVGASVETREATPQWVPYIGSTDVDATVEAATRRGATVTTAATSLPNAGRYAVLTDPQGATFGVHGSPTEPQPERPAEYGEFHWHELATTADPDEAFAFYSDLFGWEELGRHDMGPIGIYLLFGRNGKQLGGMFKKGDMGKPGPAYWVGYVRVKDLDETVERIKAGRGSLLNGPMEVPGGDRIAQFIDPHGAFFAVHMVASDVQRAGQESAAPKRSEADRQAAPKSVQKKTANKTAKKQVGKAARKKSKKANKTRAKKTRAKKTGGKSARKKSAKKAGKKKTAKKAKRSGAKRASRTAKRKAKRQAKRRR
jgi:predicted enzyme related to lactoylglutathione lyase